MDIVVHQQISQIDQDQWNSLLVDNNPFMRHEFLRGLEQTKCVTEDTGWEVAHLAAYADAQHTNLIGAMPCYIKSHSYGEYIFDWAWADAHHRHGLDYYPKLSNAVPFTPATGQRCLGSESVQESLISKAIELTKERSLSSFHSLFLSSKETPLFETQGCSIRHSSQFHWRNRAYTDFDDFLADLNSKKRKNIKRERRRVHDSDVQYQWLTGDQLDEAAVNKMHGFYQRTINWYGAQSYLNLKFFRFLAQEFSQQTLFLFAYHQDQIIAGGLYFKSDNTLYGRYWGALANFHSVHFETCYYQAIEWCIKHGYEKFEAGAQGQHKLARGLEPAKTWSAHWVKNPAFRDAIDHYLQQEQRHIEQYQKQLGTHSPFKSNAKNEL